MSSDNVYYLRHVNVDVGALDFGICNGFVYLIKASGEVWINRLSSSVERTFIQHNEYRFDEIFEKENFIKIANIHSFPLDSISYGNRLFILSEEGCFALNLSFKPSKTHIDNQKNFKVISATKHNGLLFFSCREKGFIAVRPFKNRFAAEHYNTPSTKILISGNTVLNLYPETPPKIFKINSYNKSITKRELISSHMTILTEDDETNQIFKKMDIIGRDIIAPYSTPDRIVLPTIEDTCLFLDSSNKRNTQIIEFLSESGKKKIAAGSSYENQESLDSENKMEIFQIQEDCIEEQPIALHYHPQGMVAEYWDAVKFISKSGQTFDIIQGKEIAEVRTYPDNPRYHSLIAIATDNSCHLKYIPIDSQKNGHHGKEKLPNP